MKTRIIFTILPIVLLILSCGNDQTLTSSQPIQPSTKNETKKMETTPTDVALSPEERLGKRLFLLCTACHNLKEGEPHKVGPNLHGIFGTKAGLREGFVYSEALKNSSIVWNDKEMKAWIENPTSYIPGTNMAFIGLTKEKQQDALIAYLKVETN